MKISYKGDYALKAMLDLALHYNIDLVTSHDLAGRIDAPIKFLEQVLLELRKGGFIESRRGNNGGYLLSKSPEEITVGDVVRHIEGPIEPIACVGKNYTNCGDISRCVFKKLWTDVYEATANIVDNVTFAKLVQEVNSKNRISTYVI